MSGWAGRKKNNGRGRRQARAVSGKHCTFWRCGRGNPGESSSDEREEFGSTTSRRRTPRSSARAAGFSPNGASMTIDDHVRFMTLINSFCLTRFVNEKVYNILRWQAVEIDERDSWTPTMALLAIEGTQHEIVNGLQTAIRRGVPDSLKPYIISKCHNAEEFLRTHAGYVQKTYVQVFGKKPPDFREGRVPTFSGGFEGVELDIHSSNTRDDDWKVDVATTPEPVTHRLQMHPTSKVHPRSLKAARSISWENLDTILAAGKKSSIINHRKSSAYAVHTPPALSGQDSDAQKTLHMLNSRQLSFGNYNANQWPSAMPVSHSVACLLALGSPAFSGETCTLKEVTSLYQLLSPEGQTTAKKILWAINSLFPHIEFAPTLAPLICILLCYVEEEIAFVTIIKILEKSNELLKSNASRPFITFRRSEYVRFVKMAMAFAEKQLPTLMSHLSDIKVDMAAWFARVLQDGFARLLPFDLLLRIYLPFLFEGTKVFVRYALALLKTEEEGLLFCSTADEANLVLLFREYRQADPDLINDLTKLAFRFQIRANNEPLGKFTSHDLPTPYLKAARIQKMYRPRLHEASSVIQDDQWEIIWRWLPNSARILDPELTFTSNKHGHSIKAIQRALWEEDNKPMIFLLSTRAGSILGGICPFPFKYEVELMGPESDLSSASVFQLAPHQVCYRYTGAQSTLLTMTSAHIFYGSNSPAISVDGDLLHGHSAPSETFNSPCLVPDEHGDFEVTVFEIWLLE